MVARSNRRIAGVTLVELLIAMAISTLVIGLATLSFSLFSNDRHSRTLGFQRASAQNQRVDLLFASMEATVPWMVRSREGRIGFYFLGRPDGLTLVSNDPVFGDGAPSVVRIFRERDTINTFRLVYEEASLVGLTLRDADQKLPFRHRMVVLTGLKSLTFRYFGWPGLQQRMQADTDGLAVPQWFDEYDGLRQQLHPLRVGLSIDQAEAVISMPEREGVAAE